MLGALGIVYGDIGTSPLYALNKCFTVYSIPLTDMNILGIISLIFWTLMIIVTFKYVNIILRADNQGEGGILSLSTLCLKQKKYQKHIIILSILGMALFFGDGVITPAISVLGALEGLEVISHRFEGYTTYLTIALLLFLFYLQKKGTWKIGLFFGPIMTLWFLLIGMMGIVHIIKSPVILWALNPWYGLMFLMEHGFTSVLTFGAIILVVTGAEALYADLGHFNKSAIRWTWFSIVFPCLTLNYIGQGGLLMTDPTAIQNPFYHMVPAWGIYPLVILAMMATIIASQSIISGLFSLSHQAISLGYLPRMKVVHTSSAQHGQVYVPLVNRLVGILTIIAVLIFQDSEKLASAYGITITGIMLITTLLAAFLAAQKWKWGILKLCIVFIPIFVIDFIFWGTNFVKISDGGWFPLLLTIGAFIVVWTWREGREALLKVTHHNECPIPTFVKKLKENQPQVRLPGTAVFMCRTPKHIPHVLNIHMRHNSYVHEQIFFLSIMTQGVPHVHRTKRLKIKNYGNNIYGIIAFYGFMEVPNLHAIFEKVQQAKIPCDFNHMSFFLSHGVPIASPAHRLNKWQEQLFILLTSIAHSASDFFKIPLNRVIEIGIRYRI